MEPFKSLSDTMRRCTHVGEIAEIIGELAYDSLIKDDFLRDMPMLSFASSLIRAGNNIQGYFLAKKICRFLSALESTSMQEREEFIEKWEGKQNSDEDIGEMTLQLIDKAINAQIAEQHGRALALLIKGKIGKETFDIYSYIIKDLNPYLIKNLRGIYGTDGVMTFDGPAGTQLANYGLIEIMTAAPLTGDVGVNLNRSYAKTAFGQMFFTLIIAEMDS